MRMTGMKSADGSFIGGGFNPGQSNENFSKRASVMMSSMTKGLAMKVDNKRHTADRPLADLSVTDVVDLHQLRAAEL